MSVELNALEAHSPSRAVSSDMYEALHPSFFPIDVNNSEIPLDTNHYDIVPTATMFFKELAAQIGQATSTVDLQFYTIEADPEVNRIVGAALNAANRGVAVRILVDHIVSAPRQLLPTLLVNRQIDRTPNITMRCEQVARDTGRLLNRNHKKVVVIDGHTPEGAAYVGGINLAARSLRWN